MLNGGPVTRNGRDEITIPVRENEFMCVLCLHKESQLYAVRGGWKYFRCSNCGLISLWPHPNEEALRAYYNRTYSVQLNGYRKGIERNASPVLAELDRRVPSKGKLLEIGCSYGFFLQAAANNGWYATGIELDENAVRYGREELGTNSICGTLESSQEKLQPPYDAVVSFHVIEHLPDPPGFLRLCRSLLRDGGTLILKTPNISSWIANRTRAHWSWLSPPAHIHLFSPDSLRLALETSGFNASHISSRRGDAGNNLYELFYSLARRSAVQHVHSGGILNGEFDGKARSTSRSARAVSVLSSVLYAPLTLFIDPFLSKRGLQPELLAIAQT